MSLGQVAVDVAANTGPYDRTVSGIDGSLRRAILGSAVGNVIADGVSVIAKNVANVGKKILDVAVGGGFDRALNIQDARASLTGLGHDAAEVDVIMSNALTSVKGTAYGLDEAGKVAATAVAAGIEPGEELTRVLTTIADTTTIAGDSMSEIGDIFNSVAASGKVTGETLNQLSDRGVPALQFLADELGLTSDAVSEMVSAGEIDFATFEAAMRDGLGGAALASGNTARGAFENVKAAIGRLGEMFAGPIVGAAPALFQSLSGAFDSLAIALEPVVDKFANWLAPAMESVAGWIDELDFSTLFSDIDAGTGPLSSLLALFRPIGAVIQGMLPTLVSLGGTFQDIGIKIGTALAPLLPVLADALLTVVDAAAPLVEVLVGALAGVLPVIAEMLAGVVKAAAPLVEILAGALADILPIIAEAFTKIIEAVEPLIPIFADALAQALPPIATALVEVVDAALPLVEIFSGALADVLPIIAEAFTDLIDAVEPLIGTIGDALVSALTAFVEVLNSVPESFYMDMAQTFLDIVNAVIPLVPGIIGLVEAFIPMIPQLTQLTTELLPPLLDFFTVSGPLVVALVEIIVGTFLVAIQGAIDKITWLNNNVLAPLVQFFTVDIPFALNTLSELWATTWNTISVTTTTVWNTISTTVGTAINTVSSTVTNTMNTISSIWSSIWNTISSTVSNIWNSISSTVSNAINTVRNNVTNTMNALSGAWSSIWNGLQSTVSAVVNGINGAVGGLVSTFSGLPGRIGGALSGIANTIKSPFISAFNAIARAWNNTIGKINISIPDVPGTDWGGFSYSAPRIPYAKRGAYLTGLGSILVGENGPELLNLPKGASVVPLNSADGGIEKILSKMMSLNGVTAPADMGGFQRTQTTSVTVHVGGVQISITGTDESSARAAGAAAAEEMLTHLGSAVKVR